MIDPLEFGREAFARQSWAEACRAFRSAPRDAIGPGDLERLAVAAHLIGDDDASARAWEAAHHRFETSDRLADAARCAFWLALGAMLRGRMAQATGWFARTEQLVALHHVECPATGYLLIPQLLGSLDGGDAAAASDAATRAVEIGARFGDGDLVALGTLGHGQALIALGDTSAGVARLDAVMVAVTTGEVGPVTSGIVYCAVILECMRLFDLPRATEWTEALSTWCDAQPDLVPYRGVCLIHRSQLQQIAGDWSMAMATAHEACRRLSEPPHPALGAAYYQEAELHRLRGEFDDAEATYRKANRVGFQPMPGMALLELARGDPDAAAGAIRRVVAEREAPVDRPPLLAAAVDILGLCGDEDGARVAADELAGIAARSNAGVLSAMAAQAVGSVLLVEGEPAEALPRLRDASTAWQQMQMPYERARSGVLLGLACAALGDPTSVDLEFGSAREIFTELGARPDLRHLEQLSAERSEVRPRTAVSPLLSAREREVLVHVAAGETNRTIAAALVISEHTVGRHLENIFAKLGVTTRAAATASAYEHGLL